MVWSRNSVTGPMFIFYRVCLGCYCYDYLRRSHRLKAATVCDLGLLWRANHTHTG